MVPKELTLARLDAYRLQVDNSEHSLSTQHSAHLAFQLSDATASGFSPSHQPASGMPLTHISTGKIIAKTSIAKTKTSTNIELNFDEEEALSWLDASEWLTEEGHLKVAIESQKENVYLKPKSFAYIVHGPLSRSRRPNILISSNMYDSGKFLQGRKL